MKTKITFALSTIVLLAGLTSCGKSSSSNSANSAETFYKQCQNNPNPNCFNNLFTNQFGPNSNGYFSGYQNFGGYNCQTYTIPSYGYGGYGTQQYVVAPQGAYLPQYGINGTGGSFNIGIAGSFNL
jgi:hypothetical protein